MSDLPKSEFFTVGPVVLSYCDTLFKPRVNEKTGTEQYSTNIIYGPEVAQQIHQYVEQIGNAAFPNEWNVPNRVKKPIRSTAEKEAYAAMFPNQFFSAVKSLFKPAIVDNQQNPIPMNELNPMTGRKPIYGGVVAYVSINVWSIRHPTGGPVVSLGIAAVMKYQDGNPIPEGGAVDVAQAFANVPKVPASAAAPIQDGSVPSPVQGTVQPAQASATLGGPQVEVQGNQYVAQPPQYTHPATPQTPQVQPAPQNQVAQPQTQNQGFQQPQFQQPQQPQVAQPQGQPVPAFNPNQA